MVAISSAKDSSSAFQLSLYRQISTDSFLACELSPENSASIPWALW